MFTKVFKVFLFLFPIVAFVAGIPDRIRVGKVSFSHKRHIEKIGNCQKCHHLDYQNPQACNICHGKIGNILKPKEAHLKQCLDCHKKENIVTSCGACHIKKKEKPIEMADIVIGSITFSHKRHIEISCSKCHHKDIPQSCKNCHLKPEELNIPKLKGAYHQQCILCHKVMKGPVECRDCHNIRQQRRKE
ncbi:MAG: cytochrome c3 family protein [bacterium]